MKGRSTLPEGRVKMINREDMLELTRRMTPERACFTRLAGAYITEEGEIEDTFNINFRCGFNILFCFINICISSTMYYNCWLFIRQNIFYHIIISNIKSVYICFYYINFI